MTGPATPSGPGGPGDLAERQAALVAALVAGAEVPTGFDAERVSAARSALLVKRADEVAEAWPLFAVSLGADWRNRFAGWAAGRRPVGALRDGWDFARDLAAAGELPELGGTELAERKARWRYDGRSAPRRRRLPRLARRSGRPGRTF